ncbi:ABC transporter ATP-binding protein [Microbacterium sp. M3]|uniref:ABC transporter ATP-binding protein n=1 Tax=Microbacterium arthrosphaerae TaxID=792652 RepID=A0ABU4H209_9MICO|nr:MULTISPECIES: ABC transporter ATP-binding protein [Microbacterium]MDW4573368.1 ABC transporter ATP-binding protein [Microbacterium arthrosphaerae]MDW7607223.1 ABC transporter ATP-binding protein [Microbacterium sp. M3]
MAVPHNPGPVVVRVDDVTKRFTVRKDNTLKERIVHAGRRGRAHKQDYTAVDAVTIDIEAGTTVGLLGPNGSGKSTLLKLIGGIVSPTSGRVETRGRMAALLELGAGFHPDLSGRENVYLNASIMGMTRAETDAQFDDILEFSGIGDFIDTQVKFYSSGMFVRLAFAVAVHTDPDVLLVDEVLAVGDEAFQRKCMERIARFRSEGRTIVLVSHSAAQVQELCDRGVVLQDGRVVFDGEVNDAVSALRDVLEGRRVGEARPIETTKPIEITRIELLDADGVGRGEFHVGSPIRIRMHVRAKNPVPHWSIGFSVDTPTGQMVLASNTERLEVELPAIPAGDSSMEFTIASANFGAGQYFVNANVWPNIPDDTHVLWQGARFTIVADEGSIGTVAASITAA